MHTRRSICFYTPSTDPSGMGAHMVDLVAAYAPVADVLLMARPSLGGRRLLDRAAALGARTVHLPSPRDPSFAGVVTAALAGRPVDVFHCHVGIGWEDWDGVRLARRAGCRAVVQTQHLPYRVSSARKRAAFHRAIAPVDRLVAVSDGLRRSYERIGVPRWRFATVANGVAPRTGRIGRAAARAALGLASGRPVVLTVGRLSPAKGQRHLLDAVPGLLARFPDLAVVLLGDGPLREALDKRAADLGATAAVHLSGHRPDARALLDAADVFVLPSRYEGMPLAVIEAMEAGLPVVATRVPGSEDVVVDGVTGALVRYGDPAGLGEAIGRLLADPARRRRQGAAGRCRYLSAFTLDRMARDTAAVYEAVLAAPEVRRGRGGAGPAL